MSGLKRSLGAFGVVLLAVSLISPAGSVLVVGSDIVRQAGGAAMGAFLLAIPFMLASTIILAELYAAFPNAGGLYAIVGKVLNTPLGMVVLGLTVLTNPAFVAMFALGTVPYLQALWPWLDDIPTAIAIVAAATAIGMFSIRVNAWVTGLFLAIEIIVIVTVVGLGLLHPARPLMMAVAIPPVGASTGVDVIGLALAVVAAIWAVGGADQAVFFSEEMRKPRQIGRVIVWCAVLGAALEVAPIVGLLLGAEVPHDVLQSDSPFLTFMEASLPDWAITGFGLSIAAALFNAIIAMVVAYGRLMFATGRDGVWSSGISAWFGRVHRGTGAPWLATLVYGGMAASLCVLPFHLLVIFSAGLGFLTDIIMVCALLVARRRGLTQHSPYLAPVAPLLGVIVLIGAVGTVIADWADPEAGRPGMIVGFVVTALCLAYYVVILRRREGWGFRLPASGEILSQTSTHGTKETSR